MTRIFDSKRKSGGASAIGAGDDQAGYASDGTATVSSADEFVAQFGQVGVLGEPGVDEVEGTAGNASVTITVPTGKYWRLIGLNHLLVTDATVANRDVVILTRTAADATIETITHASVAASTTAKRTTLFGTDDNVRGDRAVAAQGTLTIAEPVTADDTIVLGATTLTFVAALSTDGTTGEILIGASEAATKLALNAALVDRDNGGVLHSVTDAEYAAMEMTAIDFATDDMVFTANVKGTAGNSLATTETLTHGSNVFDAATLGTTTAGLDAADKVGTLDHPTAGPYLGPGEDINISVTLGEVGDALDTYLWYVEYDEDVS